jgi:1-deoxy-D-xylulose-5-phosphate reductoisomerase
LILKKRIAILGSTGSIGRQALDVIHQNPSVFECEVITAQSNYRLLIEQGIEYRPNAVVIGDDLHYKTVHDALQMYDIKVFSGQESIVGILEMDTIDCVLVAIMGFAGLKPALKAIEEGKQIALANKEALVVAGDIVTSSAHEKGVCILPVDSEHSAIFQCLAGEYQNAVEKIYLTASGGPFRNTEMHRLRDVKKDEALKHPNWDMGDKITIDSATLMNKGLEVIEARWLFDLAPGQIDIIIHPQSIIHSIVQFQDGSMKAQLGIPDMKLPIQYALSYPYRLKSDFPRFNFMDYPQFTFELPDMERFPNLILAYEALNKGGNMPCILNAANEMVVEAYLRDSVGFFEMTDIIAECMQTIPFIQKPGFEDYVQTDKAAREKAMKLLNK